MVFIRQAENVLMTCALCNGLSKSLVWQGHPDSQAWAQTLISFQEHRLKGSCLTGHNKGMAPSAVHGPLESPEVLSRDSGYR